MSKDPDFSKIFKEEKPELVKADFGPYASRIYKFTLFDDGEHYMEGNNALKFLHFNNQQSVDKATTKKSAKLIQSRTVAALALSPNGIRKTIADFVSLEDGQSLSIPMVIGVTVVSLEDTYNRKVGRDESVRKMAELDIQVLSVKATETHLYVNLAPVKGIALTLRLNRKTGFSSVLGQIVGPA